MKYYIISGEPSGDLHGSRLISALKSMDPEASFRAWGGDLMQAQGASIAKHIRDLAIMGIGQVLLRLPSIYRNFRFCHQDIEQFQPDVLILIDYSGFNLRIAKWAKQKGYKVFYYIAPQVWATRASRVKKIKKYVDKLFVILPFEEAFYQKYDYLVDYVGHPLLDNVDEHQKKEDFYIRNGLNSEKPIIALLPGSRRQELKSMLAVMLAMPARFPDYQFLIAAAPTIETSFYAPYLEGKTNVKLLEQQTYDILAHSHAALVTSGTATLETALFGVPQVVCYKTGALFYWIVKKIIKLPFISLVNIIMGRKVVTELIQKDLNEKQLEFELEALLKADIRQVMLEDYQNLRLLLGNAGASKRAAKKMLNYLNNKINSER